MVELTMEAVPVTKGKAAFLAEVRNSVSKVANLTGWRRESREWEMARVEDSAAVEEQWRLLMNDAKTGTLPVWEWNRRIRAATGAIVLAHYRR
jgi:hypothetical protein